MDPKLRGNFHLTSGESIGAAGANSPVVTILRNSLRPYMSHENEREKDKHGSKYKRAYDYQI